MSVEIGVTACASWLPGRLRTEEAEARGSCPPGTGEQLGLVSVTVSDGVSGPEMASRAARTAMERSGTGAEDVELVLHASIYYQGQELWAPASYVQRAAVGNQCPAFSVGQVSNGGMGAVELATSYLRSASDTSSVLITTGDRFCPPGFDRWNSDPGTVYADGGTALVLSRNRGFARLLSVASASRPELEGMHRGAAPFGAVPFAHRDRVDLGACKDEFVEEAGRSFVISRMVEGQRQVIKEALAQADTELDGIDWFVLPHLGRRRLSATYFTPFGIDPGRSTWEWGRTVGHLGAGDQFSGLTHLVERGAAEPGHRILMAGVGAGFSWTCAVIEIEDRPSWGGADTDRAPRPTRKEAGKG